MDFSTLKYNLRSIPTDQVFDTYPDLFTIYQETLAITGFSPPYLGGVPAGRGGRSGSPASGAEGVNDNQPHKGLCPQQAVSLVVYTYHQSSPLVKQIPDMHKRRREALKLLSFTLESADDLITQKHIIPYIVGGNRFINHLAIHFCKFEPNSHKWIDLCRKQDMLDDVYIASKEEIEGTKNKTVAEILTYKLKLDEQAEGLQRRINQLSAEIFAGDANLSPLAAAHDILEKRKPILTAERYVASKRQQNTN